MPAARAGLSRPLFTIGDASLGTEQFNHGRIFTTEIDEFVYAVGTDEPATGWPIAHPGPLHAATGYRSKTITIAFDLAEEPIGDYELYVRVYAAQGPTPQLRVHVNGESGLYFLDVVRETRQDITVGSWITGWAELAVSIPARRLRPGANRISLTTVSVEELTAEERRPAHPEYPYLWGSSLQYSCVELRPDAGNRAQPRVRLVPLPLYVQRDGTLCELVDLLVDAPEGFIAASATVTIGDDVFTPAIELGADRFGQVRARFPIPERDGEAPATVEVDLDGVTVAEKVTFRPCRKWTLHLLPHVHLDIGYTDFQAKVVEIHSRNLDRTLAILAEHPEYAFTIDGSFIVKEYLQSRSPEAGEALLAAVRAGKFGLNAFYALFLTGLATLEECYRAGYESARLEREHGIAVQYANLTDVPSYSSSLPSVLHSMGIEAFFGIQNHGRAATEDSDELHLKSPFMWEGPDGARVLTFFSDCYSQLRRECGCPPTVVGSADALTRLVHRYERDEYAPSDIPLVGIYADNEDMADGEAAFVDAWSARYAYPKLRYSTIPDYLASVRPLADELPVVRGDGGSYWEDGVGAAAEIVASYRRAQMAVPAAETCAVLAAIVDPTLEPALPELDRAWAALLIGCEHTWTWMHATAHPHSHQSVDQLAWKRYQVETAGHIARDEALRALSQLAERVTTGGPGALVCNTASAARSGIISLEVPAGCGFADESGALLPLDVAASEDNLETVRFVADEVPAFGLRTYALVAGAREAGAATFEALPAHLETARYDVSSNAGRITGLTHRASGRQLLDPASDYALGELLYVAGPTIERTKLWDYSRSLPDPDLTISAAEITSSTWRRTPFGHLVALRGDAPTMPEMSSTIEFFDGDDRVEVTLRFTKQPCRAKESVYVAFPFAATNPVLRYDRQQSWVNPHTDHTPGACNEWFTTGYGVAVNGDEGGVVWTSANAPLFASGDVVRGRWPRTFAPQNATVLSWVMNNYWWTNYPAEQGGDLVLRYAFTPTEHFDEAAAGRFGRHIRQPLSASAITWNDKMDTAPRQLGPTPRPLLDAELPDHVIATVARGRAASGVLVRLQELAGDHAHARIRLPEANGKAWHVDAVERPLTELVVDTDGYVTLELTPYEVASVRLS